MPGHIEDFWNFAEMATRRCTKTMRRSFMKQAVSNAENARALWQVGKSGEFGDNIQFLEKALLTEMLTGEKNSIIELQFASVAKFAAQPVDMKQFLIVINPDSVLKTENLSFERISPESNWQDLGNNFLTAAIRHLMDRKDRQKQQPIWTLFDMDKSTFEAGRRMRDKLRQVIDIVCWVIEREVSDCQYF
ncbi:uncharacterized protein RAG0_03913 [Rhynchosporium agropyri]|uniref:Uncharacterized protein n=1 Tax=Rhynchosporium agropyri TaxID=914238 RepID=A0A1E1K710_9HELO|nr:uncharacterized protein RAG0_03913 [Rhynchosporium agropyri]